MSKRNDGETDTLNPVVHLCFLLVFSRNLTEYLLLFQRAINITDNFFSLLLRNRQLIGVYTVCFTKLMKNLPACRKSSLNLRNTVNH